MHLYLILAFLGQALCCEQLIAQDPDSLLDMYETGLVQVRTYGTLNQDGAPSPFNATGTGFLIHRAGYFITARHSVDNDSLEVDTSTGALKVRIELWRYTRTGHEPMERIGIASIVQVDVYQDIALLYSPLPESIEVAELPIGDSLINKRQQKVAGLGYRGRDQNAVILPLSGTNLGPDNIAGKGWFRVNFSQTIENGFSGGPIFDMENESVIGVITKGAGTEALAVPSNYLSTLINLANGLSSFDARNLVACPRLQEACAINPGAVFSASTLPGMTIGTTVENDMNGLKISQGSAANDGTLIGYGNDGRGIVQVTGKHLFGFSETYILAEGLSSPPPGTVMAIADSRLPPDTATLLAMFVEPSSSAYSKKVVGVIAGSLGTRPGVRVVDSAPGQNVDVVTSGRAPVRVCTEGGEIRPGTILVASSRSGVAMAASGDMERTPGVVIGKSLGTYYGLDQAGLPSGEGLVVAVISLR